MKLLHVLAPARFGGLESVVLALATGQGSRGHSVSVAALRRDVSPAPPLLQRLRESGVDVREIVLAGRSYWRQLRRLQAAITDVQPDIVHSHGYHADILLAVAANNLGTPTVSTVHGFTGGGLRNRFYEWLQTRAYQRFDAVLAVSASIHERLLLEGVTREKIHLVRNAWMPTGSLLPGRAAREALGIEDDVFSLGWVGRVSREKGLDVLVQALVSLRELPVQLTVIGDGSDRPNIEELSRDLGVADRIQWVGTLPDAGRFMTAFDCFVLSSRTEGTPITLFESMDAATPIVATHVGGVPEMLSSGTAVLVPPDRPSALADAIRNVMADRPAAADRARLARDHLRKAFALEPWLRSHEQIYGQLGPPATG